MQSATYTADLHELPAGALLHSVTAVPGRDSSTEGLRVRLEEAIAREGVRGVDWEDQATFFLLPIELATGTIRVRLRSDLLPDAPDFARGFAGIAFHAASDLTSFECVYVRPTNGLVVDPGEPRNRRAIQYFAYPDWPFSRLRQERPDGPFEAGAQIGLGR